jgi:hypothetical protein
MEKLAMNFPTSPMKEEFFTFLHSHTIGYQFGPYKLLPESNGLWFLEDRFCYRCNADGLFIGPPASHEHRAAWIVDTVHSFQDAYALLRKHIEPSVMALPDLH